MCMCMHTCDILVKVHIKTWEGGRKVGGGKSHFFFALILFQYRAFPFPYVPVNFLHPFRFIRKLPPLASPPLLTFLLFSIPELPRHQQLLACILSQSQYLNSPHPLPGQKNVHGIQPNVSAYNNGVSRPPPYGGKVQEAGARVQKNRKPSSETINLAVETNSLGPAQIHAGPKENSPHGPENTQASPPHFLWP